MDEFELICAQVQLFTTDMQKIELSGFRFTQNINQSTKHITLNAYVRIDAYLNNKIVEIRKINGHWTIAKTQVSTLNIKNIASLYLPHIFCEFQLGALRLITYVEKLCDEMRWSCWMFSNYDVRQPTAFAIKMRGIEERWAVFITVTRNSIMYADEVKGTSRFGDDRAAYPYDSFTTFERNIKWGFRQTQWDDDDNKPSPEEHRYTLTQMNTVSLWEALDKLANILNMTLPLGCAPKPAPPAASPLGLQHVLQASQ